jgi:rhodanese-related sulfurtransferase
MTEAIVLQIDVEKLKRMQSLHVNFLLFDVRSAERYHAGHIKDAFNIPMEEFKTKITQSVKTKDAPVVIYDEDGTLTPQLVLEAEELGFINVVCLEGGYAAYVAAKK